MLQESLQEVTCIILDTAVPVRVARVYHRTEGTALYFVPRTEALNQRLVGCWLVFVQEELVESRSFLPIIPDFRIFNEPIAARFVKSSGYAAEVSVVRVDARGHLLFRPVLVHMVIGFVAPLLVHAFPVHFLTGSITVMELFAAAAALERAGGIFDFIAVRASERAYGESVK